MHDFKQFNIKPRLKTFSGDKIKISKIFNKKIVIHDFKIVDSTKKENTKCLYLSLEVDAERRVLFTGSVILMDIIEQIPKESFPFTATIVQVGEGYEFA